LKGELLPEYNANFAMHFPSEEFLLVPVERLEYSSDVKFSSDRTIELSDRLQPFDEYLISLK
jgi:hypothetical protein